MARYMDAIAAEECMEKHSAEAGLQYDPSSGLTDSKGCFVKQEELAKLEESISKSLDDKHGIALPPPEPDETKSTLRDRVSKYFTSVVLYQLLKKYDGNIDLDKSKKDLATGTLSVSSS